MNAYLIAAFEGFVNDPPDSEFQRGYLAALLCVWDEAIGGHKNPTVEAARALMTPLSEGDR